MQKLQAGMRPALAIVNNFEAKKMLTQSPGSPIPVTPGSPATSKKDKSFALSASNVAKLATENTAWVSAVRKLINAQQSIFLRKSQDWNRYRNLLSLLDANTEIFYWQK